MTVPCTQVAWSHGAVPPTPSAAGSVSSAGWQAWVPELGLGWGQALSGITWLLLEGEEASALRGPVLGKLRPLLTGATRVLRPPPVQSWSDSIVGPEHAGDSGFLGPGSPGFTPMWACPAESQERLQNEFRFLVIKEKCSAPEKPRLLVYRWN